MECPRCHSDLAEGSPELCPACGADLLLERVPRGLSVERSAPESGGYRADAAPTSAATVSWRWWRMASGRHWAFALALVFADLLLVAALRYVAVSMESWVPALMIGLVAGIPLLMFHITLAQRASSRTTLYVDGDRVSVRWGPWWGGERSVEAASIGQFFARGSWREARVFVQRVDGSVEALARHLTPFQARFVERLLEATLVIPDGPVQGELPRDVRDGFRLLPWIQVALLAIGVGGVAYVATRPMDRQRGISVYPNAARFTVQARPEEPLEFWTATRVVAIDEVGLSSQLYALANRVHIEIALEHESGQRIVLQCDPFETSFSDWRSQSQGLNTTEWTFVSRMDGCVARVDSPGSVAVDARLVQEQGASQLEFERLELIVR